VQNEASLDIIQQTEALIGFVDLDDIHETSGIVDICSYFGINLNEPSHNDHDDFAASQRVLQTVSEDEGEWDALA